MYAIIGIYIALGLLALGILAMLVSGIRGMINGEQELKKYLVGLLPFVIYAVSYAINGDVMRAGIATLLILLGLMVVAIVLTGLKTTFNL